jgi:hypothetical protein
MRPMYRVRAYLRQRRDKQRQTGPPRATIFCISKGDIVGLAWPLPELHVPFPVMIVLLF